MDDAHLEKMRIEAEHAMRIANALATKRREQKRLQYLIDNSTLEASRGRGHHKRPIELTCGT